MRLRQRLTNVLCTLALAVLLPGLALAQSGTWTTKAPMPTARTGVATGVIAGQLYVASGSNTAALEVYDPALNTWTSRTPIPTNRAYGSAEAIDGKLYVVGGCINSDCRIGYTNILEVYDPATDIWTAKASMQAARSGMVTGVIAGKLYVAGGSQECGACLGIGTLEVYDPVTNVWTTKASMPTARAGMGGSVIDGKLYVAGGIFANSIPLATLEVYDPSTDLWTTKAPMPAPRFFIGTGTLNGILYAVSGYDPATATYVNTVEAYDPATDTWTTVAPIPTARFLPKPQSINGVLYVAGNGPGNAEISTLEAFTPADTISPVTMASANPPANAAGWNNGAVTVTLSATDAGSGVQSITYSINGGAAATVSGASASFTVSAGGTHTISYYASDVAGNIETAKTLVVKIDALAPSTTASAAPPPNANGWNSGSVTVTLNATDTGGSGVQSISYTATNGSSATGSSAAGASTTFTVSAEGVNTIAFHAVDNASNLEAMKTLVLRIDKTAPVLSLPRTVTASAISPAGAVVNYTVTATDNSGLAPSVACMPASGSTFPIGTSAVVCSATDAAGNSSSGSFSVTVLGTSAQTTTLIGFINGLGLAGGIANSLTSRLDNAVAALASGNVTAACNMLSAFVNQASAQSGKQLTTDQAAQLIASASRIRAAQGCP